MKSILYSASRIFALTILCLFILPAFSFAAESFIASSPNTLNWFEAKKFCESKGGKLPLINNADILNNPANGISVDGFGTIGEKWTSTADGTKFYWLGTTPTAPPHKRAHVIGTKRGLVSVSETMSGGTSGVVCVPK